MLEAELTARKKRVNRTLLTLLRKSGAYKHFPKLDGSLQHTVLLDGKRLRPIMALLVYELFESKNTKRVLEPACALELIHAGSLMLDDLPCMDNAATRRGKKTNHVMYGDATTILASAALWIEAFHLLSDSTDDKAQELVRVTTQLVGKNGLVLGQYMDLFAFHKKQSLKDLQACYELKTGSLFLLAVEYGAILGHASPNEHAALRQFGAAFGLAYQIRDDIIDATQTEVETGKDAQKDAANGKPNYVSLLGTDKAKAALQKELQKATQALITLEATHHRDTKLLHELTMSLALY